MLSQRPSFEEYAIQLAQTAALRSEDTNDKVGAVILHKDMTIAATGYNGPPSGIDINWKNNEEIDIFVIHAEVNALRLTTPREVAGGLLAITKSPCINCLKHIAAYGISRVLYDMPAGSRHWDVFRYSRLFDIDLIQIERRNYGV